jgi:HEAT repeat protein
VLLALESLPTASIWKVRIPDAAARANTWALAGRGAGYIERPSGIELDTLEHYLALTRDARAGDAGVVHLSRLAAVAGSRLAHASVARLATLPELNAHLDQAAASALIDALLRRSEGDVGSAVLVLIEARRPANLRGPLVARIDATAPDAPAILHAALGALDGQIVDERALALLASHDEEQRLAAARWARGDAAITRLRSLTRHDPSPSVRAAALRRLETLESIAALPEALDALDDPAPEVRRAAAESIASMGPVTIPDLRRIIDFENGDGARTAIAALGLMGESAARELREIAETNPDPGIRTLAEIALGLPIGHRH